MLNSRLSVHFLHKIQLLPCANLELEANQFKSNKLVPVTLPSPNHQLTVDPGLASLEPDTARLIAGREVGSGVVELLDRMGFHFSDMGPLTRARDIENLPLYLFLNWRRPLAVSIRKGSLKSFKSIAL